MLCYNINKQRDNKLGVIMMTVNGGSETTDIKLLDAALQKKSIKLVVMHLEKKISAETPGIGNVLAWLDEMNLLLEQDDYVKADYIKMRKKLYDAIEWVPDTETRQRLRNSWYSFGKALEKKVPRYSQE